MVNSNSKSISVTTIVSDAELVLYISEKGPRNFRAGEITQPLSKMSKSICGCLNQIRVEQPVGPVSQSSSCGATNNPPFPKIQSQHGKVGCQNCHPDVSAYSAAGGEHDQQEQHNC